MIVHDRFKIDTEIRDCLSLFERLRDTLSAGWGQMYQCAKGYAAEHGNLEVPKRYTTKEGYSLGTWLQTQRMVRAGKAPGILTEAQIALLDQLGMRWERVADVSWERNYAEAKKYFEEHGDLLVPISDKRIDGVLLGR